MLCFANGLSELHAESHQQLSRTIVQFTGNVSAFFILRMQKVVRKPC